MAKVYSAKIVKICLTELGFEYIHVSKISETDINIDARLTKLLIETKFAQSSNNYEKK